MKYLIFTFLFFLCGRSFAQIGCAFSDAQYQDIFTRPISIPGRSNTYELNGPKVSYKASPTAAECPNSYTSRIILGNQGSCRNYTANGSFYLEGWLASYVQNCPIDDYLPIFVLLTAFLSSFYYRYKLIDFVTS